MAGGSIMNILDIYTYGLNGKKKSRYYIDGHAEFGIKFPGITYMGTEMQHLVRTQNGLCLNWLDFHGQEEDPLPETAADDSARVWGRTWTAAVKVLSEAGVRVRWSEITWLSRNEHYL